MPNTNAPAAGKDERAPPPLEHHPNDCYSQTERFLFPKKEKQKKSQNCLEFASHFAPAFKHFLRRNFAQLFQSSVKNPPKFCWQNELNICRSRLLQIILN